MQKKLTYMIRSISIQGSALEKKKPYLYLKETYSTAKTDAEIIFFSHDDKETKPDIEIIKCDCHGELNIYPDDFLDE